MTSRTQWKNYQLQKIEQFRTTLIENHKQEVQQQLERREYNDINFYNIASHQQLPKYLQKLEFKTIHLKQKTEKKVKIFKSPKKDHNEQLARKHLKSQGKLLFLSEIFTLMNTTHEGDFNYNLNVKEDDQIRDLEEWEKQVYDCKPKKQKWQKPEQDDRIINQNKSMMTEQQRKTQQMHMVLEEMRNSKNYAHEVMVSLQTLSKLHVDEKNLLVRTNLIQNNARLIKNELDNKKERTSKQLGEQEQRLQDKRKEYHSLFVLRNKILTEQKQITQERTLQFEESKSHSLTFLINKTDKRLDEIKTRKAKVEHSLKEFRKQIEALEISAASLRDQQKAIEFAELLFYRTSLKIGIDCRESGLSWLIMELKKKSEKVSEDHLPNYLDKKGKEYLLNKTHHEQFLDQLIAEKFQFVKLIMKETQNNTLKRVSFIRGSSRKPSLMAGDYKENYLKPNFEISKKYARSSKLINKINQISNEQVIMTNYTNKNAKPLDEFTFQFDSARNCKQLYQIATKKLKNVYTKNLEHSKIENQKSLARSKNLNNYNNLLLKIKQHHVYLDDLDLQHQNHLFSHYKDNKEHYLEQAAACFGIKKAYTMFPKGANSY